MSLHSALARALASTSAALHPTPRTSRRGQRAFVSSWSSWSPTVAQLRAGLEHGDRLALAKSITLGVWVGVLVCAVSCRV